RDHRRIVSLEVAHDLGDVWLVAELGSQLLYAPRGMRTADIANAHQRDDAGVYLPTGRCLEAVGGLDRLSRRVVRAVRAHLLGHTATEHSGPGRAEHRDDEDPPTVELEKVGKSRQHHAPQLRVRPGR